MCVTGLIVVDTATYFTTGGQAFLLLLIQLGGLGIITFTTLIMAALGVGCRCGTSRSRPAPSRSPPTSTIAT